MIKFSVDVSYAQIAVFNSDLEDPFNDWTDRYVSQGFSWRLGSVSFRTLIDAGNTSVDVIVGATSPTFSGTRIISVPFSVFESGTIEVASIADGHRLEIPPGNYQLVFETGDDSNGNWCKFTFVHDGSMTPQILRADANMAPSEQLLMDAVPA